MRHPASWMVCGILAITLVGCSSNNDRELEEPIQATKSEEHPPPIIIEEPKVEMPMEKKYEDLPPPSTSSHEPIDQDGIANLKLDTLILVNKQIKLPEGYVPDDLVEPNIRFLDTANTERRLLREEAARAIEALMTVAGTVGIDLKGTSAYRSYNYQVQLFDMYVNRDGRENAMKYSAVPGHSEHQTGLAIDVSSSSVNYQLTQRLGESIEGRWLAEHAHLYGFIIRYPLGSESVTGYVYEPWHLRYIGIEHATAVYESKVPFDTYVIELFK